MVLSLICGNTQAKATTNDVTVMIKVFIIYAVHDLCHGDHVYQTIFQMHHQACVRSPTEWSPSAHAQITAAAATLALLETVTTFYVFKNGLRKRKQEQKQQQQQPEMSTAMNFSSKSFQPRPPDKGSFPLDHFGNKGHILCDCTAGCIF